MALPLDRSDLAPRAARRWRRVLRARLSAEARERARRSDPRSSSSSCAARSTACPPSRPSATPITRRHGSLALPRIGDHAALPLAAFSHCILRCRFSRNFIRKITLASSMRRRRAIAIAPISMGRTCWKAATRTRRHGLWLAQSRPLRPAADDAALLRGSASAPCRRS